MSEQDANYFRARLAAMLPPPPSTGPIAHTRQGALLIEDKTYGGKFPLQDIHPNQRLSGAGYGRTLFTIR